MKSGRGWWALAGVVVVVSTTVIYPLSIGPAVLIDELTGHPEWMGSFLEVFYAPLRFFIELLPSWAIRCYGEYLMWWIRWS